MTKGQPNYDRAAALYDEAARIYSAGRIKKSKLAGLAPLSAGDRVLFLGAGAGEEVVHAAAAGMAATSIDLSAGMLARLEARLARRGLAAELIRGDALAHQKPGGYDAVAANYFLNVFARERMLVFLAHAASLVRPGGLLTIADIAPPTGSLPARLFNRFWARAGMAPFWVAGLVAWHPTYDYRPLLPGLGFSEETITDFPLFRGGPVMFRSIVARKARAAEP